MLRLQTDQLSIAALLTPSRAASAASRASGGWSIGKRISLTRNMKVIQILCRVDRHSGLLSVTGKFSQHALHLFAIEQDRPAKLAGAPILFAKSFQFDTQGQLQTTTPITVSIDRDGTGAASALTINLKLSDGPDRVTALSSTQSAIASTFQDGFPLGTLSSFLVDRDGIITGSFTNGLTRTLGQVALATFNNFEGLSEVGDTVFQTGANSGTPVITTPGLFGTGKIVGGSLEQSNVDLGAEFIDMIQTSTGYSAASRVVKTADELLQQLLVLGR